MSVHLSKSGASGQQKVGGIFFLGEKAMRHDESQDDLEVSSTPEGSWRASSPSFPALVAQGETPDEARLAFKRAKPTRRISREMVQAAQGRRS